MFDIDKLFITFMYYHKGKDGKMTTEYEDGTKEHYVNDLLHCYLSLLTDKGEDNENRTAHLQHASIDGDTKLLKDIIDDIEKGVEKPTLTPYAGQSLSDQVRTKSEFITGKFGIGPFALNNNSQILTMLYGVEFQDTDKNGLDNILSLLGLTNLNRRTDRDGNSIFSWLSGLINAHVDVAKDPWIARLNVNKYTYNLINLLVRTGFGSYTFYMTTQPIMKELATAFNSAASAYMRPAGVPQYVAQKDATDSVLLGWFNRVGIAGKDGNIKECIEAFKKQINDQYHTPTMQLIKGLFSQECDVLRKISKDGTRQYGHIYDIPVTYKSGKKVYKQLTRDEVQLLVAIANEEFRPYAQALADLVKYSKIDTNKHGKNITEQRQYLEGYHDLFDIDSNAESRAKFVASGLNRMSKGSYIERKTTNAIDTFLSILKGQVLEASDAVYNSIKRILVRQNLKMSEDTLNKATRAILAKIKSGYFFAPGGYCERFNIDPKSLVSGDNTILDRLNRLKHAIHTDPKYSDLLDSSGEISNYLIRSLIESYKYSFNPILHAQGIRPDTYQNAKFIKLFNFTEEDTIDQDSIIDAWDELLNDGKYPELQEFARDLVVYAFMTSGDNGGFTDLFKYVPGSWRQGLIDGSEEQSYAAFMEKQLEDVKNIEDGVLTNDDIVDVLQNSWYDDNLVPAMSTAKINRDYNSITLSGDNYPIMYTPKDGGSFSNLPMVFKVQRSNSVDRLSQRKYILYVLHYINGQACYVAADPKGGRFPNGHHIYEMSRQDNKVSDVLISLISDRDMYGFAKQFGIPMNSVADFFEQLGQKLSQATQAQHSNNQQQDNVNLPIQKHRGNWSRSEAENNPNILYVFTDNTDRNSGSGVISDDSWYSKKYGVGHHYPTMTAAVVRGLDNSRPISTQRWYHYGAKGPTGRWWDTDLEEFKRTIRDEIEDIIEEFNTGKYDTIMFPDSDGLFNTKISNISKSRTPQLYQALADLLYEYGFDSLIPNDIKPSENISRRQSVRLQNNNQATQAEVSDEYVENEDVIEDDVTDRSILPASLEKVTKNQAAENTRRVPMARYYDKFGRIVVSESARPFVTENVQIVDVNGNRVNIDAQQLDNVLKHIFNDKTSLSETVTMHYSQYKRLLETKITIDPLDNSVKKFECFVENYLIPYMVQENWVTDWPSYDKKTKQITIGKSLYNVIQTLISNPQILSQLYGIVGGGTQSRYAIFRDITDALFSGGLYELYNYGLNDKNTTLKYSYTDSRQLDLFNDSNEFSVEEMNHCKH